MLWKYISNLKILIVNTRYMIENKILHKTNDSKRYGTFDELLQITYIV